MTDELVGEVRVKVRPDSTDWRREAARDIERATDGLRAEVPIDGKLRIDQNQVQRQLDAARNRLRGGDVKIVAKVESNIEAAYKEWGKASDKVKDQFSELEKQQKKFFGANEHRNDSLRKSISLLSQEAGRLRKEYEQLGGDTALKQARENLKLEENLERVKNAQQANLEVVEKMTANELKSYMERVQGTSDYLGAEEEYLRRLGRLRSKANFDTQAEQARNNAEIERENRRHLDDMNRDFRLRGMPEDSSIWSTQELIRAKRLATEGFFDQADASRISQEIQRRLAQQSMNFSFDPGFAERAAQNKSALQQYMQGVDNHAIAAQFQQIRDEADKTSDHINNLKPHIEIQETGLLGMAAQLKWASRPRHVPFYVKLDEKSLIIAEGILKSLSGLNTLETYGRQLENLVTQFDRVALKTAGTAMVLGGLVNTISYVGTGVVSLVGDLARLSGGLAMVPAVVGALGANVAVHMAAFKDFKAAIDGNEEALNGLPPAARAAAESLQGLWDAIAEPVQNAFWDNMPVDDIPRTVRAIKAMLIEELSDIADGMALAWSGVERAAWEMTSGGVWEQTLENMAIGAETGAAAFEPLIYAISELGLRGSEYLPNMGTWISDIANRFNNWVQAASDSGRINFWIERAYETLQDVWSVGGSVTSMFQSLYRVAQTAGSGGLAEFANSLERIANQMKSEPWQSRMSTILAGANKGASALNKGFLDLSDTIGESSGVVGLILDQLGQLGGGLLSRIANTFSRTELKGGILDSLKGMNELLDELEPGFESLGDVLGGFAGLAGDVFASLAPVLNDSIALLETVTDKLAPGLGEAVPALTGFLALLVQLSSGPILIVADVIAGLVDNFNELPGPVQTAVLALAGLIALRGQLGSFLGMIGNGTRGAFSSLTAEVQKAPGAFAGLATAWREQRDLAQRAADGTKGYASTWATSAKEVGYGRASLGHLAVALQNVKTITDAYDNGLGQGRIRDLGTAARDATGHFGAAAGKGLIGAAGGLMGALGGPWGIAIMGAITLIASFGAKAQASKAQVDALKQSLDEQGNYTQESMKKIADAWTDLEDAGDPWANFSRGSKAANESVALMGVPLVDVTNKIMKGGEEFTKFRDGLQDIADAKNFNFRHGEEAFEKLKAKSDAAVESLGLNREGIDQLNAGDLQHVIDNITKEETALRLSELAWKGAADAAGTGIAASKEMASAMETIGNQSIDAAGKIDAIRTALDLLKGGTLTAQEAQMASAKAQTQAVENARALAEEIAVSSDTLFDATGMLNSQSLIGQKTFDLMKSSADSLLIEAQAAFDAAIMRGETAEMAGDQAMSVMGQSDARLQELADAMGVSVEDLRAQWETFFGQDWELEATFAASTVQLQEGMEAAKQMGLEWDAAEFTAWLMAQPDPAKVTSDQISEYMHGRMREDYVAALKAVPDQALGAVKNVAENMNHWENDDYIAWLESQDKTHPGIKNAVDSIARMTGGDYAAAIKAINETYGGIRSADWDLNNLSDEEVAILSKWLGIPPAPQPPTLTAWIQPQWKGVPYAPPGIRDYFPGAYRGAIVDGSNPFAGKFPMQAMQMQIRAFANGGFDGVKERPGAAKIYSAASTYRVFAEKGTGGEAFIPLGAYNRARSIEIWRETGKRLGVTAFEEGGISGTASLLSSDNQRPIAINIHGVPTDQVDATVTALRTALKQASRSGKYN